MSDTMEVHSPKLYRGQCINLDKLDFSWFNTLGPGQITWSCFGKSSFWIIRGFTGRWERFWQWHHRLQLIAQGVPYGYSHRKSFFSFWDLEQSKTFYRTKMFSLLQHSFQFSNSKNLQNENAERTAHSSPCFPVNTQWYQGRYWCNRKRNYQEKMLHSSNPLLFRACYSVPCHLSRCHWACHALSHTDDLTPSALWCKPLLAHTSTIILAATKSSAYASEQVKSKQHGDEHLPLLIWMAITAKLIHVTS